MESILSIIIKKIYIIIDPDWDTVFDNPNPDLAHFLESNFNQHKPNTSSYMSNPNPGMLKHIINTCKFTDQDKYYISLNPNPDDTLVDLILSNPDVSIGRSKNRNPKIVSYLKTKKKLNIVGNELPGLESYIANWENKTGSYWSIVSGNSNEALTDYLIENRSNLQDTIFYNSNPGLTDLIISLDRPGVEHLECLVNNTNPLLADYIMSKENDFTEQQWYFLSMNNNPGLTNLLIRNPNKVDYYGISGNNNPGLTEFILENLGKLDKDRLANNTNPRLKSHVKLASANPNAAVVDKHYKIEFNTYM